MRKENSFKKLVVWSCLGAGTVIVAWTVFTVSSPPWLSHSIAAWMRREPAPLRPPNPCLPQEMRRKLASELVSMSREMLKYIEVDNENRKWSAQLDRIAGVLDPRLGREELSPPSVVCPETFNSTKFVEVECDSAPPISKTLSVILPARRWDEARVSRVMQGLREKFDLTIFLLLGKDAPEPSDKNIVVLRHNYSLSDGDVLNAAVKLVRTSHVLIGEGLTYFSWEFSPLTRLLRVMDRRPAIGVAAGAYRDDHGEWRHGCLQRSIANYHATFIRGYEYSEQECMFCDDALGPFVARTHILRKTPLSTAVEGALMYRDWYTGIQQKGNLHVVCPDVMFFVDAELSLTKDDWMIYARHWRLQSVSSFDNKEYKFTCTEAHLNCDSLRSKINYYLIPPCCREILVRGMALVDEFAERHGVSYEMHHGSLIGAVKLGSYLPWDFDHDIFFDCRDKKTWMSLRNYLKKTNSSCSVRFPSSKTPIVIQCKTFFIDMVCRKPMSTHSLPEMYRNVSTWIDYGGHRIPVMANPGAGARDFGGKENLRHEQHWRVPDRPLAGAWRPCQNPNRVACLDRHPADGSLAFSSPPRCLP